MTYLTQGIQMYNSGTANPYSIGVKQMCVIDDHVPQEGWAMEILIFILCSPSEGILLFSMDT